MIVNNSNGQVLTNSNQATNFGMNPSAEAFRILSDGIYEHKIAAIVRELCCNAWDSHIEAGKTDTPIHIEFPNDLRPYFSVEDFGIGLDEEGVRSIFTVYFGSTKNQQELPTGCLGLGSKSPLSYTDTFSITSRYDGTEYHFVCYINEEGIPAVNKVYEKSTDEVNGVKITLPVKRGDNDTFFNDTRFVMSLFDLAPTTNRPDFTLALPTVKEELDKNGVAFPKDIVVGTSGIYRVGDDRYDHGKKVFVVMGNVAYKVDGVFSLEEHHNRRDYDAIWQHYNTFMPRVMFIKVPMGAVKFTASRETLSLDDNTRRVVGEHAIDIVLNDIKQYEDKIDAAANPIEAIRICNDLSGGMSYALSMFKYKGKSLASYARRDVFPFLKLLGMTGYDGSNDRGKVYKVNFTTANGSYDRSNLVRGVVVISPKEKTTGIVKYARETAMGSSKLVLSTSKILTASDKKRLSMLAGGYIEFVCVEDLRKADLERKRIERAKHGNEFTVRAPRAKPDQIRAVAFRVSMHTRRCEKESTNTWQICDDIMYAYIDRLEGHNDIFIVEDRSARETEVGAHVRAASIVNDKEVILLVRNSINQKKIEKNNIPHIDAVIKDTKDTINSNKEVEKWVFNRLFKRAFEDTAYQLDSFVHMLVEADSIHLTDKMNEAFSIFSGIPSLDGNPFDYDLPNLYLDDVVVKVKDDVHEWRETLVAIQDIRAHYPLYDGRQTASTLIRYIKMEDIFVNVENL